MLPLSSLFRDAGARLCLALTLAGGAGLLNGCAPPAERAAAAGQAQPKTVGVVTVTEGDVARTLTQPATIQGADEAILYAKASGYLKTLYVDKGDRVHAGQLLAVIESPELIHQREQARAGLRQALSSARGANAARVKAEADAAQAGASVERAQADARTADASVAHAQADVARAEAQVPRLKAQAAEAQAGIGAAQEAQAQAEAQIGRWEAAVRSARSEVDAQQAVLATAQSEARIQELTYKRLKSIQDQDKGLIPGQDVDVARSRMEVAQSGVDTARHRLEAAKAEIGTAQQQLASAKRGAAAAARQVDAARSHADAAQEALQAQDKEIAAAREQVKVAQAQADSAKRQVAVAQAGQRAVKQGVTVAGEEAAASREQASGTRSALASAEALADYTRIVAPFDGVVTERLMDPGAFVQNAGNPGSGGRGVLKVVRDRSLRVLIPVPEGGIASIRNGQPAAIVVDAFPKETFTGTVTRSAASVDPKSRTMLTEVDIPNPGGKLRPGMYARVTLTLETHHGALSVPSETVMGKDEDRFVYTVEGGKVRKTPVKVGVDDAKSAEITDGLKRGAQVVFTGRDTVVDGAAVKAEPAKLEPAKK